MFKPFAFILSPRQFSSELLNPSYLFLITFCPIFNFFVAVYCVHASSALTSLSFVLELKVRFGSNQWKISQFFDFPVLKCFAMQKTFCDPHFSLYCRFGLCVGGENKRIFNGVKADLSSKSSSHSCSRAMIN